MLKIWGRNNSINVQKVLWCCEEMQVPFKRVDVGGEFGGLADPAFRAMNPNGLIPVLEDDGFVLWESNAIVRYLSDVHGHGTLWPDDARARADAGRWMDWSATQVWPPLRVVFIGLVRTPDEQRNHDAIAEAMRRSADNLAMLNDWLAKRDFVAGEHFTMGDIPLGAIAYRWFNMEIERPTLPHLERWYERLVERPAYRKVIMLPLT